MATPSIGRRRDLDPGRAAREARFSEHPMGEGSRHAAIEALDAVHAGLRSELESAVVTA